MSDTIKKGDYLYIAKDICQRGYKIGDIVIATSDEYINGDKYIQLGGVCEGWHVSRFCKATNDEIKKYLIDEATKKGFTVGKEFRFQVGDQISTIYNIVSLDVLFSEKDITRANNSYSVKNGVKNGFPFVVVYGNGHAIVPLDFCQLVSKEPFLPEDKTIKPPKGYYLLGANDGLQEGDLGFFIGSRTWEERVDSSFYKTPSENYIAFKSILRGVAIAFARKITNTNDKKEDTVKKELKKVLQKITIRVGPSNTFHKIIQQLYFDAGYQFGNLGQTDGQTNRNLGENAYVDYIGNASGYIEYKINDSWRLGYTTSYNAETQLQEIVKLLEEPPIKVPKIHGYKAEYKAHTGLIAFGCAHIDIELLTDTMRILERNYQGDRRVSSINLSVNNRILNSEQIKEILDYIKAVDKAADAK